MAIIITTSISVDFESPTQCQLLSGFSVLGLLQSKLLIDKNEDSCVLIPRQAHTTAKEKLITTVAISFRLWVFRDTRYGPCLAW
jgi:hypothetical protein